MSVWKEIKFVFWFISDQLGLSKESREFKRKLKEEMRGYSAVEDNHGWDGFECECVKCKKERKLKDGGVYIQKVV